MKPRSLRAKILCLAALNLLLLGVVLILFARLQFRLGPESLLLGPARDRIVALANAFRLDIDVTPPSGRAVLLADYGRRYDAEFFLTDPLGNSLDGAPLSLPPELVERMRPAGPPMAPHEMAFLVITRAPTRYWVGVRIPLTAPDRGRPAPAVLLLRSGSIFNSSLFFDWRLWLGVAFAMATVSGLCWLPFVRGLTQAIARMDRVTEQIAHGRFDVLAPSDRSDELGHLGRQVNSMATRLESFVKNQKRFLGDIAHELCAPLARVQFALGILEQKAQDVQRPHVEVLHEEIQEMSNLVNELLSFSKAGMQPGDTPLAEIGLAALAARAVAREAHHGTQVEVAIDRQLTVMAHEPYLLRALANVLRNAIRYSGEEGPIRITARQEGRQVVISVADQGHGLPDSELEAIFAPFYRPESARTRGSGGAGLGLAIVKSCVEACRGTVECRNRKPSGLEVMIHLAVGGKA